MGQNLSDILKHMEVPERRGVFLLGCFERRVTLYSQQVRALNLVHALFERKRLQSNSRLVVVGAGAGGLTVAAGAALRGCQVTVLEQKEKLLPLLAANHTRWLHPHIYDWPAQKSEAPSADLPVLNWAAGKVDAVVRQLQQAWEMLIKTPGISAQVHLGVHGIAPFFNKNGDLERVGWNDSRGYRPPEAIDALVLAVGFGVERQDRSQGHIPYWENDGLDQSIWLPPQRQQTRVLISGTGDGGLVDLLRAVLRDFDHERIFHELLESKCPASVKEALLAIEESVRNGHVQAEDLFARYRALNVPASLDAGLKDRLRPGIQAVLNGESAEPLNTNASIMNRFLVSRLLQLGVHYRAGRVTNCQRSGEHSEVTFGSGRPERFDRVIFRHGPQSTLEQDFDWLPKEGLAKMRSRSELDQTRDPLWPAAAFAVALPQVREKPPAQPKSSPRGIELFGHTEEVEQLVQAVLHIEPRPTIVLGPPGIGKTTITQAALHDRRVEEHFQQRRYFVRLDGAETADSVIDHTARALGLTANAASATQIEARLTEAPSLLVFDNAETPWQANSHELEDFLRRLSQIRSLALVLSIRGYRYPRLPHANPSIRVPPLSLEEARNLFCSIADNVDRGHPRLPGLLGSMGYVPLAIVLLAHAAQGSDLELTLERWDEERTAMLSNGEDRRSNFAVSIEFSLSSPRMTAEARRLLSTLALLPSGVAHHDRDSVLPGRAAALATLEQAALVYKENWRWRILAPIREYLLEKRPPLPEDRKRVIDFYFELASEHGPRVGAAEGNSSLAVLDPEYPNLEALLRAVLSSQEPNPALDVLPYLNNFMRFSGHGSIPLLKAACELSKALGDQALYAGYLRRTAQVMLRLSEHAQAHSLYSEALPLFEKLGDIYEQGQCIRGIASIELDWARLDDAQAGFERALEFFSRRAWEDASRSMGNCVHGLGKVAYARGDYGAAREQFERARQLYEETRDSMGHAHYLRSMGDLALVDERFEEARRLFEQARDLFHEVGDLRGEGHCLRSLGETARLCSRLEEARGWFEKALPILQRVGSVRGAANCHKGLGRVALQRDLRTEARGFFKDALTGFERVRDAGNMAECQRLLDELRQ